MTNKEKLQKVIAAYTPLDYSKIDMTVIIKDKYIAAQFKDNFCADICSIWRNINATQLRNDMFVRLNTGDDILKILNWIK
jgi:hypothetical protein